MLNVVRTFRRLTPVDDVCTVYCYFIPAIDNKSGTLIRTPQDSHVSIDLFRINCELNVARQVQQEIYKTGL
jgi:hypothetical protein